MLQPKVTCSAGLCRLPAGAFALQNAFEFSTRIARGGQELCLPTPHCIMYVIPPIHTCDNLGLTPVARPRECICQRWTTSKICLHQRPSKPTFLVGTQRWCNGVAPLQCHRGRAIVGGRTGGSTSAATVERSDPLHRCFLNKKVGFQNGVRYWQLSKSANVGRCIRLCVEGLLWCFCLREFLNIMRYATKRPATARTFATK